MELFHTSPNKIEKITKSGRFGEFLCFSANVYEMSACETITYKIAINEDEIIDANSFFYREDWQKLQSIVEEVMELAGCDEDEAQELLSQRAQHDDAEVSWDIQKLSAKAAKALGFRAVATPDEQGTCYLVDMLGRETELEHVI